MSLLHFHSWKFVSERELRMEVRRWDGTRMWTEIMQARFLCRCGASKKVITDESVRYGTFEVMNYD